MRAARRLSVSPRTGKDVGIEMRGLLAKRLRVHIVGAFVVALGVAAAYKAGWCLSECEVISECKEFFGLCSIEVHC
ncbi:cytochrome c oxidase, subunit VIc, isoform CRA_a [Rattus norvegicus]|uniref:Cytochrome c oxidase, subunit VIc, isoform CRA_a n=1 Tax=Rattus norvegicus TaxID=10116 RepID=A6HR19_RAT|nr:cytochrome c oxidase, subunit VIc, isoform CRA_a [Rattus norvegicus]